MRPPFALAIIALLALPAIAFATPGRAEDVDIYPVIAFPLEKGDYETETGIVFNATLVNSGTTDANQTGSVQLEVKNRLTGSIVWKPLSRSFKDVPKGGGISMEWPRWSPSKGGDFQATVYVTYFGDTNANNNKALRNFSMHSENWVEDPALEDGKVLPVYGTTETDFTYSVVYTYNKLPDIVKVRIDGVEHTMLEDNPSDVIAEDGKKYVYVARLPVGDHDYNFTARYGDLFANYTQLVKDPEDDKRTIELPFQGPWVNITLNTEEFTPTEGYVTTDFRVAASYGSAKNLPPDEMVAIVDGRTYGLVRESNSPVYTSGRITYFTRIIGYDLLMPPVNLSFRCRQGTDALTLGPFSFKGPSILRGELAGAVMTDEAESRPIEGALIRVMPGNLTTTSGPDGSYRIGLYEGYQYTVTCTAEGFLTKTAYPDIAPDEGTTVDFLMPYPPVGGTLKGTVYSLVSEQNVPVEGIRVVLAGTAFSETVSTNGSGGYIFRDIPGGEGYSLTITEDAYVTFAAILSIQENQVVTRDVVLMERAPRVSVYPPPGDIPLEVEFQLQFDSIVNFTTVDVSLDPPINTFKSLDSNMTTLRIVPQEGLWFATNYTLTLSPGVRNVSGNLLVWRTLSWTYRTPLQMPGTVQSDPGPDSTDVPLSPLIRLTISIGILESTLDIALVGSANRSALIPLDWTVTISSNDTDHLRSWTEVDVTCGPLSYGEAYILTLSDSLLDIYGRRVFSSPYNLEFTTMPEPDRDGDGYADSADDFPDDPLYHSDRDGDGVADEVDDLPDDPTESVDTDGDGTGNEADTDDDGDGMPDEWELTYGLDPLDPKDAFEDLDGDGSSNIDEYKGKTRPNDRSDHPKDDLGSIWIWLVLALVALIIFVAIAVLARYRTGGHHEE